ncbi:MAG: TrkA family potassium uptake protein [Anaerolineae bacterium]|nr:TrkA family potassium uptake protein [Anaerolineae bacterium]
MPRSQLLIPATQPGRVRRSVRWLRASWRNARVIWREFNVPIVVFLIAVFGGGWLYGLLWDEAGHPHKPYWDRPYEMATMMIFAAPADLPEEGELVIFWYVMPVIGAFIAARGVADFVNLFFSTNRTWEEAVASTYANHVIVLGVGHLGTRVIRELCAMGIEVVAIDFKISPEKQDELRVLKVPLVEGDGRLAATMEKAGIRQAQALIVCTSNDHMNLEVTMRARDLNPGLRIVMRMWEDQFKDQIARFMDVEAVLSATDIAAPTFAGYALGIEITQTMTINGQDYSMIQLIVNSGSFLDGKTVGALQEDENLDIVLHSRADDVQVHPAGDRVVRAGDTLVLFALHRKIVAVVARNRRAL